MPTPKQLAAVRALKAAELEPILGRPVEATTIKITNVGDGLSKALALDPKQYALGEEVTCVVRGVVSKIEAVEVDPDDDDPKAPVNQSHTVKGHSVVVLSEEQAKQHDDAMKEQEAEWVRRVEESLGIDPLPGMDAPTNQAAARRESIQAELSGLANAAAVRAYAADYDVDLSALRSKATRRELEDAILAKLAPTTLAAVPDENDGPPADGDTPDPDDAL